MKQKHAECLASLFPSSSSSVKAASSSSFNPIRDSVNLDQKLKKKGNTRIKPFKLWVVVGDKMFTAVPKSSQRKALNKRGRIKKIEFRRSMSKLQVQNRIVQTFPSLKLSNPTFMKCVNLKMVAVDLEGDSFPNGSNIQSIASKESLYLVESRDEPYSILFSVKSFALLILKSDSSDEGPLSPKKKALIQQADEVLAKLRVYSGFILVLCWLLFFHRHPLMYLLMMTVLLPLKCL